MRMITLSTLRTARDALRYGLSDDMNFERFMVVHDDVLNLCDEFDRESGCPTPKGIARAERFVERARNWTPLGWRLYGLWRAAVTAVEVVYCDVFGHEWVDDSYGGPDTGCMAGHCARCGFSFHHTLY